MSRNPSWIVLGLLLGAPILLAQDADQAPAQTPDPAVDPPAATAPSPHAKKHTKAPPPLVLPPLPAGPLSQLPMDQIPSTPAKVTYQAGLLTISAQNSTLGEILRDVRKLTGATIEVPPGSNGANERVVTRLGPAPTRDVLIGLLNGSSYNYVMIGSNADPAAVSSVILTPKEKEAGAPGQAQASGNVYQTSSVASPQNRFAGGPHPGVPGAPPQPGNGVAEPADAEDAAADEPDPPDDAADDQPQAGQADAAAAGEPQPAAADPNQPNAPKTPEQILEMLRKPQQQPGVVNGGQQPGVQPPTPQPPEQ